MMCDLEDKCIELWHVVYDFNADSVYTFTDYESVKSSIIGSIATYCDSDDELMNNLILSYVQDILDGASDQSMIPITVNNLSIVVYKYKLDRSNKIWKVLAECYNNVDGAIRDKIKSLFA